LGELADIVAKVAANADPDQEYCSSFLLPRSLFEREVIEAMEVGWGTRRTAVRGELIRIDFDVSDFSLGAIDIRQITRMYVAPLVECFGCIIQETAEGLVILAGNQRAVESDGHVETLPTDEMVNAGLAAISGFELLDAWEGYLGKADLVRSIYSAMAAEVSHQSCRPLS
jgi:hypothetical protein